MVTVRKAAERSDTHWSEETTFRPMRIEPLFHSHWWTKIIIDVPFITVDGRKDIRVILLDKQ